MKKLNPKIGFRTSSVLRKKQCGIASQTVSQTGNLRRLMEPRRRGIGKPHHVRYEFPAHESGVFEARHSTMTLAPS